MIILGVLLGRAPTDIELRILTLLPMQPKLQGRFLDFAGSKYETILLKTIQCPSLSEFEM